MARSGQYHVKLSDADYADDLELLANTPAQAESQLHIQVPAVEGIYRYMNGNKRKFMCFKQKGAISTLSGKPLKLEDQFTYLGTNISSTESDVNIHLAKVCNAIDSWSILWKSDVSNKIKWDFFQAVFILLYGCTIWTLTKRKEKS